jgi:hypothetical protein
VLNRFDLNFVDNPGKTTPAIHPATAGMPDIVKPHLDKVLLQNERTGKDYHEKLGNRTVTKGQFPSWANNSDGHLKNQES